MKHGKSNLIIIVFINITNQPQCQNRWMFLLHNKRKSEKKMSVKFATQATGGCFVRSCMDTLFLLATLSKCSGEFYSK